MLATRIASSLDKSTGDLNFSTAHLRSLISLGGSEVFGEMIASNPALILALPVTGSKLRRTTIEQSRADAVENGSTLRRDVGAETGVGQVDFADWCPRRCKCNHSLRSRTNVNRPSPLPVSTLAV